MRASWPLLLLLTGCGLKRLLPEGPVLTEAERAAQFGAPGPEGHAYDGPPGVSFPVIPFQVFGAAYALDLVIVSTHPDWDMHEIARIDRPEGPLWIVKDARAGSLAQVIVADLPDIADWMPEIPVERVQGDVQITDASTAKRVDVAVRYTNAAGEPVALSYVGKPPVTRQKKRNGSTMGHSKDAVVAVLDIPYRTFGRRSTIEIGGERYRTRRILGLLPFRTALVQTQGGIATGDVTQAATDGGFAMTWASGVTRTWEVTATDGWVDAWQRAPERDLHYRFAVRGDALELALAESLQAGRTDPTVHIEFSPPLVDVRRPFSGTPVSRFVVDVNGQQSHAVGEITARWTGRGAQLDIRPTAPWWVADRPMSSTITWRDEIVRVHTTRSP